MVYWIYQWLRSEVIAVPGRVIALLFIIFMTIFPIVFSDRFILYIITIGCIYAIYAASWDVLAGCSGQVNLGQGLFFGVSAYACALLNLHFGLPPWVTIPCGAVVAAMTGVIAGLPGLRLRGIYLSLVTLSFPIITTGLIMIFSNFTGGELGLTGIDRLSNSGIIGYYIILLVMLLSVFGMLKITDTRSKWIRLGVILHAIREDEIAARTSGINTAFYKLMVFGISGLFSGIAGGLYVHTIRSAGPSTLELMFSFQALLWSIFGGIGTIYGAVVGVFVLHPTIELASLTKFGEEFRFIGNPVLMILVLLFMPEGIAVWVREKLEEDCPRCKEANLVFRSNCRICQAPLK